MNAWLDSQAAQTLYISAIAIAEMKFGISALAQGKRQAMRLEALDGIMPLFADSILPFDADAALRYGDLAVKAQAAGEGFPTPYGHIPASQASDAEQKQPTCSPPERLLSATAHKAVANVTCSAQPAVHLPVAIELIAGSRRS